MDSGHTAWLLMSSALVLFMTPGLAFFYGGMVRAKNVLAMLMKNYVAMGVVTILWVLVGASLTFSGSTTLGGYSVIGDFNLWGLRDLGLSNDHFGLPYPDNVHIMFQLTFAIITPALISGAIAERMKFTAWAVFIAIWSLLVYVPVAHWVWGGGFIGADIEALDFAGGLVVHINAGAAALALLMVLGPRIGFRRDIIRPHSLPLTVLGAGILWFGWFGFNGGSGLAAGSPSVLAFANTLLAPAATLTVWFLLDMARDRRVTAVGGATAVVVGCVCITPAAGFIGPMWAIVLGGVAAVPSYALIMWRPRTRLDESLDVLGAHGIGGLVGILFIGIFAQTTWNGVADGLAYGSPIQLWYQFVAVLAATTYSFVGTWILLKLIGLVMPLRVEQRHEALGLDVTEHGEEAYARGEGAILVREDGH